jgi:hypothetical protein
VIPDLVRHAMSGSGSRILDGWRSRLKLGLLKTKDGFVAPASEDQP